jgi:predicted nucleic acid-binding protein
MNLVDSSCWLEYFSNGKNADIYEPVLASLENLLVPTIILYEVFKKILQQKDETEALKAIAIMHQGTVVELSNSIAINAAKISFEYKLPMADSIILATAREYNAVLWTQDEHFEAMERAKYIKK